MSNRWQASATYTLSYFWDAENQPFSGLNIVPFPVAKDLGNEFTYASSDQRHRAVFSGIWEVAHGFQLSGLHYFGAGIRSGYNYGGDLRGIGARRRPASARMGRLFRGTASFSPSRTRPTFASSSGSRCPAGHRST
jgi:hypothetical protein